MGAFILAALIVLATLLLTALYIFGNAMSDTTGTNLNPFPILLGGLLLAAMVAASHFLPPIGW